MQDLSPENRRRAAKALERFEENPRHRSLNFERLAGNENLFSIRISLSHRAILRRVEDAAPDTYELIDVGPHDIYRRL